MIRTITAIAVILLLFGMASNGEGAYFATACVLFFLVTVNLLFNYRSGNLLTRIYHSLIVESFHNRRALEKLNSIPKSDNKGLNDEVENKIKELKAKIEIVENEIKVLSSILNENK